MNSHHHSPSTIFLGNLSILCNETNLHDLFSQFGPILTIRLKKSETDPQRAHLSYGFIDFCFPESIEKALKMNNTMFFGRLLRVGRAEDYSTRRNHRKMKEAQEIYKPAASTSSTMTTAQVHVMFTVHSLDTIVSEMTLREIFGQMGNLEDVVIKKNVAYDGLGLQSGYGFIHYGLDEKGIESALRAVEMMNHRNVGGVYYECSLTHGLKTYLLSLKKKLNSVEGTTHCAPRFPSALKTNAGFFDQRLPVFYGSLHSYSLNSCTDSNTYSLNQKEISFSSPSTSSRKIDFQSNNIEMMENINRPVVNMLDDQY